MDALLKRMQDDGDAYDRMLAMTDDILKRLDRLIAKHEALDKRYECDSDS